MSGITRLKKSGVFAFVCVCGLLSCRANGDRVVLSPEASTLPTNGFKLETILATAQNCQNLSWIQVSSASSIELEFNRFDLKGDNKTRNSFNVQYPMLSDLGAFPAISIGVRDLFATGLERVSVYGVIGKSIPLSDRQIKLWREVKINIGAGTGWFNGVFFGIQNRFQNGITLNMELYRYRPNISLGVPLVRNLQAKAVSLSGELYFGLSYTFAR